MGGHKKKRRCMVCGAEFVSRFPGRCEECKRADYMANHWGRYCKYEISGDELEKRLAIESRHCGEVKSMIYGVL